MYRGYKNRLKELNKTNKGVRTLDHINKCIKCQRLNPSLHPSAICNIQFCLFCGNPFYIIKPEK